MNDNTILRTKVPARRLQRAEKFVVEELSEAERITAEEVTQRIAADPTSHDSEWRNHLPEAEAIVLMQQRQGLMIARRDLTTIRTGS